MGCIYRPTYRDREGNLKHSRVWWVSFYSFGKDFRESTGATDKAEAKKYLKQREADVAKGLPIVQGQRAVRFADLADDLLNEYQVNGRRSINDLEIRMKLHLLPAFGSRKVSSLNPADFRSYAKFRQEAGARNGSINLELATIKRALNLGLQAGRIASMPHIPTLKNDAQRTGFFEPEAFESVCHHLPAHIEPVAQFAYVTGWRKEEVIGLQWQQVDFEGREVRLHQSKTGEGRTFPFTAELETLLTNQLHIHEDLKRQGKICPWVFSDRGQKIGHIYSSFKRACRKAGQPGRTFHDLRRTAIRNFVRAGISEHTAMTLSGHRTRSVFDRYDIVSPADLRMAAERLDAAKPLKSTFKVSQNGDDAEA